MCLRNAELSNNLAATRHSRTLLEREVVSLKRSVLESRSCQAQLEGELAEVRREREILAERVADNEREGRSRLREMQRQVGWGSWLHVHVIQRKLKCMSLKSAALLCVLYRSPPSLPFPLLFLSSPFPSSLLPL